MTYFGRCQRTLTAPFTALAPITTATLFNAGPIFSFLTVWDTIQGGTLYRSETVLSSGTLFAEPVTIIWQSSDLSKFPSAYATALAATMGVKLQENFQPDLRADSSGEAAAGLSVGAKVGIALGAVLGFALLIGAAVMLFLRRRKKAKQSLELDGRTEPAVEMPGYSSGFKRFFRGRWRAEADGRMQRAEMETEKVFELPVPPAELEAPQHRQQQIRGHAPPYVNPTYLNSVNDTANEKKEDDVGISELPKKVS